MLTEFLPVFKQAKKESRLQSAEVLSKILLGFHPKVCKYPEKSGPDHSK